MYKMIIHCKDGTKVPLGIDKYDTVTTITKNIVSDLLTKDQVEEQTIWLNGPNIKRLEVVSTEKTRLEVLTDLLKHYFVSPSDKEDRFCSLCGLYVADDVHCRKEERASDFFRVTHD